MARKVTKEEIALFNELYIIHGTYAAVARETGWSPSTVAKYIVKNQAPTADIVRFSSTIPAVDDVVVPEDLGAWLVLSDEEIEQIKELWKELRA
jgi:hypothetical protein